MDRELDASALTGYSLAEARARLGAAGLAVVGEIEVSPPGDFTGSGEARAVKVALEASGVSLYYAHQTYRRATTCDEKTLE